MWEASLIPYQVNTDTYGTVYVVGMAGIMNVFQNGSSSEISLDKKYVYAKSLSKGSLTATATAGSAEIALPKGVYVSALFITYLIEEAIALPKANAPITEAPIALSFSANREMEPPVAIMSSNSKTFFPLKKDSSI